MGRPPRRAYDGTQPDGVDELWLLEQPGIGGDLLYPGIH
jgi:hypothetical protein